MREDLPETPQKTKMSFKEHFMVVSSAIFHAYGAFQVYHSNHFKGTMSIMMGLVLNGASLA